MTADVAILVPVLRRPDRVVPLLASIHQATPEPHRVVFICDPDDFAEQTAIRDTHDPDVEVAIVGGSYARKINAAARITLEPLVFLAADDLHFHPGWLAAAADHITDTIGVVGTNDLGNRRVVAGDHATHNLVARWYIDQGQVDGRPGVLHEGYRHNFCDDELVATARRRAAWVFAADSVVEHLHPAWGKADTDDTYQRGMRSWSVDRRLWKRRRRAWT